MQWKTEDNGWSPYLAGALVGLLAIVSVWATTVLMGKTNYLGASTTFVRAAGLLERAVAPEQVSGNEYFSSVTDRSFKWESVPPVWAKRFGSSPVKRAVGAVLGGIVAMVGARMADGCPSGHGLSGMMQFSVSSLAALCLFFGVGIAVAAMVYKGRV
jgi:uncharacterized membrane protein YedE/YeeE